MLRGARTMNVRIGTVPATRFNRNLPAGFAFQFLWWSYFAPEISGRTEDDFLNGHAPFSLMTEGGGVTLLNKLTPLFAH